MVTIVYMSTIAYFFIAALLLLVTCISYYLGLYTGRTQGFIEGRKSRP